MGWGAYAYGYFQQKWKLRDDIKKYEPLIAEIKAALAEPPVAYAILDQDYRIVGIERYTPEGAAWAIRSFPSLTIKPLYL